MQLGIRSPTHQVWAWVKQAVVSERKASLNTRLPKEGATTFGLSTGPVA